MNRKQKAFALLLCLLTAMALTACHIDNDPWPASDGIQTPTATPLADAATQAPQEQTAITETQAPAEPEPTQTPGGSEDPGLNG